MARSSKRSLERRKKKTRISRGRFYLSRILSSDVVKDRFILEINRRWMMGRDYKKLVAAIDADDAETVGRYVTDPPFMEAYRIAYGSMFGSFS